MDITLENHHLVDGLFTVVSGCVKIYFQYVGYDSSERSLIFERDEEVVTGRIVLDNDVQLKEWKKAFNDMSIELEHFED